MSPEVMTPEGHPSALGSARTDQPGSGNARRIASLAFSLVGATLAVTGAAAIGLGLPTAAAGFVPLTAEADLSTRLLDLTFMLVVIGSGIVAAVVGGLFYIRAMVVRGTVVVIGVAGIAVELAIVATLGQVAWDAAGGVLPGPVTVITGGAALIAAALVGAVVRD